MSLVATKAQIGPADHGRRMPLSEFDEAEVVEGYHYELDRGVIVVSDVPGIPHYLIVQALLDLLFTYKLSHRSIVHSISGGGDCKLLIPPFDSERHPDISVYRSAPPETDVWTMWVPALVVEVVSPSSRERDYETKPDEYLQFGVQEFWIVDKEEQRLTVLQRKGGQWQTMVVQPPAIHRTHVLPGLELSIADIFAAVPRGEAPASDSGEIRA